VKYRKLRKGKHIILAFEGLYGFDVCKIVKIQAVGVFVRSYIT